MRVGGLQQAFNKLAARLWPRAVAPVVLTACALTVFPLIKVVSKLPLCWKNHLDSGVWRQRRGV